MFFKQIEVFDGLLSFFFLFFFGNLVLVLYV